MFGTYTPTPLVGDEQPTAQPTPAMIAAGIAAHRHGFYGPEAPADVVRAIWAAMERAR